MSGRSPADLRDILERPPEGLPTMSQWSLVDVREVASPARLPGAGPTRRARMRGWPACLPRSGNPSSPSPGCRPYRLFEQEDLLDELIDEVRN